MITEADVRAWVGRSVDDPFGDIEVERGAILHWLEATENANPLFWDGNIAAEVTDGPIAPPTMLSVWMRPLVWKPGGERTKPLSLHFALKEALGLPEGIVVANEIELRAPLRPGDRVRTTQRIREIGEIRTNRLGTGRNWTVDVTYTNQRGEVAGIESYEFFCYATGSPTATGSSRRAGGPEPRDGERLPDLAVDVTARTVIMGASSSRDWQPQHHDHAWAVERAGTRDIFLNTPNQAGWIERYLTDWTGPYGRLGRMRFRMRRPVYPGDRLVFAGTVTGVGDEWTDVAVSLTVGETVVTECTARIAVGDEARNPWRIPNEAWRP